MSRPAFTGLPDLVLLTIADFLSPEDTARLSMTCGRLYDLLPRFLMMRGDNFTRSGSGTGWGNIETYFEGPVLRSAVNKLSVSVRGWRDQGWGNRKGELFVRLMCRSQEEDAEGDTSASKKETASIVAEKREIFGIAEHRETSPSVELRKDAEVVSRARPGDWYRFMRRVGGGGGHRLTVRGFRAIATLQEYGRDQ